MTAPDKREFTLEPDGNVWSAAGWVAPVSTACTATALRANCSGKSICPRHARTSRSAGPGEPAVHGRDPFAVQRLRQHRRTTASVDGGRCRVGRRRASPTCSLARSAQGATVGARRARMAGGCFKERTYSSRFSSLFTSPPLLASRVIVTRCQLYLPGAMPTDATGKGTKVDANQRHAGRRHRRRTPTSKMMRHPSTPTDGRLRRKISLPVIVSPGPTRSSTLNVSRRKPGNELPSSLRYSTTSTTGASSSSWLNRRADRLSD